MTHEAQSIGTNVYRTIRNGILTLGLCAGLAAGSLGLAGHAEARVSDGDPRADSLSAGCGALQDQADSLREQYKDIASSNPNDPRLDGILAQLRLIGGNWNDVCAGTFGNINFIAGLPIGNGFGRITTGDNVQAPTSGSTGGAHQSTGGVTTRGVSAH